MRPRSSGNIPVSTCGGAQLYWEEYGPRDSGSSSAGALSPAAAPSTVGFPAGPPAYDKRLLLINGANGKIPFFGHAIQHFVRLGYTVSADGKPDGNAGLRDSPSSFSSCAGSTTVAC